MYEDLGTDFDHRRVYTCLYNNSVRLLTELLMGYCNLRELEVWIKIMQAADFVRLKRIQ